MLTAEEACCHRGPGREAAGRESQPGGAGCCHGGQQPHRIGSRRRAPTARPRRKRASLPFPAVRVEARTCRPPPVPCAAGASAGARSGGGGARPPSWPGTPVAAPMSEPPIAGPRRLSIRMESAIGIQAIVGECINGTDEQKVKAASAPYTRDLHQTFSPMTSGAPQVRCAVRSRCAARARRESAT